MIEKVKYKQVGAVLRPAHLVRYFMGTLRTDQQVRPIVLTKI
jgi:hypothetical protein